MGCLRDSVRIDSLMGVGWVGWNPGRKVVTDRPQHAPRSQQFRSLVP
jgi:hypothetical protein